MMPLVDSVGKSSVPQSFQYKDVGTNIDCSASSTDDGRYRLAITIEDSSIITDEKAQPGQVKGNPSFRSFRSTETLLLRDGQTLQFTSATDKISGDVVKVDVTLTVIR
jgi:type II secretory pathway component GspD/PulD (secretin)